MYLFLSIVYVLVCAFLIFVVLLQQGRGGGMGSAFGGGGSQTVFGGAGAGNVLTRITSACAALFMILSATLAYMSSSSDSTLDDVSRELEARQAAEITGEEGATEATTPEAIVEPAPEAPTEVVPAEDPTPGVLELAPQTGTEAEMAPEEGSSDPAAASPTAIAPSDDVEPTPVTPTGPVVPVAPDEAPATDTP
ncbi:MAG: preprotein translocase subunit SecG [Myxococcota bacterium]|nr:preprotein translocase subunit SecG [Myxococcota bacterium]